MLASEKAPAEYASPVPAVVVAAAYLFYRNVVRGRPGRALRSVRDGELMAGIMGVPVTRYKGYAFALSAMYAALGLDLIVARLKRNESANMSSIRRQDGSAPRRYDSDVIAASVGNGHFYGLGEIPRLAAVGAECKRDLTGQGRACDRNSLVSSPSARTLPISHAGKQN